MKNIVIFFLFITSGFYCQLPGPHTSSISCNMNSSVVTFSASSGVQPYKFVVQTPACTFDYTYTSNTSTAALSFYCPGVYTIAIIDGNNTGISSITHTVYIGTKILLPITDDVVDDTICLGQSLTLYVPDSSTYSLQAIIWSTLDTGNIHPFSPTVTTTYSYNALYTRASSSRTCTAEGYKTVYVTTCPISTGIEERNINSIRLFPNPFQYKLTVDFNLSDLVIDKISIFNTLGQIVYTDGKTFHGQEIDLSYLPGAVYYLIAHSGSMKKIFKIIKE